MKKVAETVENDTALCKEQHCVLHLDHGLVMEDKDYEPAIKFLHRVLQGDG